MTEKLRDGHSAGPFRSADDDDGPSYYGDFAEDIEDSRERDKHHTFISMI